MAPPFPRSGPGESGSPMSQVVLRCYDFPSRILGHLFVSLPRPTLPSSLRVSRLALALPEGQRVPSGPGSLFNRRCLASSQFRRCCPRSLHSEGFSVMEISGLPRGFSTCCLRFTSGVATTHARLASGGQARLYRKGVEPSGSLQKVSDHNIILLFWIYPGARRAFLHLSYSCAQPCGPATLVTHDPIRTWPPTWLIRVCGPGLFRLHSGGPNNFAPLFGFFDNELSEVGRRAREHGSTQFGITSLDFGIRKAGSDFFIESFDDVGGRVFGRSDPKPTARFIAR